MKAIDIEGLEFSYSKKVSPILNIEKFSVKQSEKVFLYGPSGCGKSTLLNVIAGVLRPQKGKVRVLEKDLFSWRETKRDHFRGLHLGIIFQSFNLIPYLSVAENIALSCSLNKKRCQKFSCELDAEVRRLAEHLGIENLLEQQSTNLSIGQQQRVAVARALIGSPEIVIADEPTSSLDEEVTEDFIKLLLKEYDENPFTLIFVSHDQRLSRFFDRKIDLLGINQGELS